MALQANNYLYFNANGTYIIPTNPSPVSSFVGLETIKVNTAGGGGNKITVTEIKTGNTIAVIDATAIHKHDFDLSTLGGVQIVMATGTPADVTVIWQ